MYIIINIYYKIAYIHVKVNKCSIVGSYHKEIASITKNTNTDLYTAFLKGLQHQSFTKLQIHKTFPQI